MKTQVHTSPFSIVILAFLLSFQWLKAEEIFSTKVVGEGQPMILIHGMSCSADVWEEVAAHYQDRFQVHLVTLKGFGNKESAQTEHYLKQVKDELIQYVKDKKLQNTILMGHSMGGFLSLWAAAETQNLFAKVISVDGIPYFPAVQMPDMTPERASYIVEQMKAGMNSATDEAYAQQQKMIVEGMIATENKREKVIQMGLNSNRNIITQAFGEMYTTDIRPEMQHIQVPVLVLGSWAAYQNYGVTKQAVEQNFQNQCKDIATLEFALADKAYHFIFYDEPTWFFEQVDSFLAE